MVMCLHLSVKTWYGMVWYGMLRNLLSMLLKEWMNETTETTETKPWSFKVSCRTLVIEASFHTYS